MGYFKLDSYSAGGCIINIGNTFNTWNRTVSKVPSNRIHPRSTITNWQFEKVNSLCGNFSLLKLGKYKNLNGFTNCRTNLYILWT
ncbi:unnamed protein product [Litomosoides sigmodontis]|uniref:Uncharacterized protein n=1 Tax=Litomosoides sigmodontis TaxID=42156 RepID=A0A3P6SWD8_LITSI|nr:unnamed protein product [Litomosoides sigmodontis]